MPPDHAKLCAQEIPRMLKYTVFAKRDTA